MLCSQLHTSLITLITGTLFDISLFGICVTIFVNCEWTETAQASINSKYNVSIHMVSKTKLFSNNLKIDCILKHWLTTINSKYGDCQIECSCDEGNKTCAFT